MSNPPVNHDSIQGWFNFGPLYQKVVEHFSGPAIFVEVGCWKGQSAVFMLNTILASGKSIVLYCIDPWSLKSEFYLSRFGDRALGLKDPDALAKVFRKNIQPYRDKVPICAPRTTSLDGAKMFADGALDFVFIDGDHRPEAVEADVRAWLPKMKPTGILAGDDFGGGDRVTEVRRGLHAAGVWDRLRTMCDYPSWVISLDGSFDKHTQALGGGRELYQ